MTGACTGCGATDVTFNGTSHNSIDYDTYYHDAEYHWITCACGQVYNKEVHYMDCATNACSTCGETDVTFYGTTHTVTDYTYQHDDTHCWYVCSVCGGRAQEDEHYVYCSYGEKCRRCEAEGVTFASRSHSWDYDSYAYDETHHWRVCAYCGEANTYKSTHTISCETGACTYCGATEYDADMVGYSHNWDWETYYHDADYHWNTCSGCGEVYSQYSHRQDCVTGACAECGATEVNFAYVSHTVEDWTLQHDDTHCWYDCVKCGGRYEEYEHYVNCSYGEKCYRCDAENVTFASRNHSWDYSTYGGYDDTYHWRLCQYCGEASTSKSTHWIKCETGACEYCGTTEYAADSVGYSHSYDYETYLYDDDYHWYACTYCGTQTSKGRHYQDCATGACSSCGQTDVTFYSVNHDYDYWTREYDDTHCWCVCTKCGEKLNIEEHYIECDTGECYYCGQTEVTGGSFRHSWNYESYEYDDTYHWRVCSYCGTPENYKPTHRIDCSTGACTSCGVTEYDANQVYYTHTWDWDNYAYNDTYCWVECAYCDAYTNYSRHYVSCSSENNTCEECGQSGIIASYTEHNWDYDNYKYDDTYHWRVCLDCGEIGNKNEHYLDCVTGQCSNCGQSGVSGDINHNYKVEIKYDNEKHWEVCLGCNEVIWDEEHSVYCVAGTCSYCEASGVTGDPIHEYDYEDRKYDDTHCWNVCDGCGEIVLDYEHELDCVTGECVYCGQTGVTGDTYHYNYGSTYEHDTETHWRVCNGCGGIRNEAEKHRVNCVTGVCDYCNAENVTGTPSHDYDSREWYHDDTHCWRVCKGCNEAIYKNEHSISCANGRCTRCGEANVTGDKSHTTNWNVYEHDTNYHWNCCAYCGEVTSKSRHEANCDSAAPNTCRECGATDVVCRERHADLDSDGQYDDNYHWSICRGCDKVIGKERHWVSCVTGQCEGCGAKDVNGNLSHYWDWEDAVYDDNYHWWICEECGAVDNKEIHWLYCQTGECMSCGATGVNGEIEHEYDWDNMQYNDDYCWMICPNCDEIFNYSDHYVDCTSGECWKCGQTDVNGSIEHNFDWELYEYNEDAHWLECRSCGEIGNYAEHRPNCATGVCANCGMDDAEGEISHNVNGDEYQYDKQYHWQTCQDCGEVDWWGNHNISCTTGVCRQCGQSDVVNAYIAHSTSEQNRKYDEDYHWYICGECGEEVYKYQHELSCTTGACIDCGQADVNGPEGHRWYYNKLYFDSTSHWYVCRDCGEESVHETHYLNCATGACRQCGQKNVAGVESHRELFGWESTEEECWLTCKDCKEDFYRSKHYISCETGVCTYCGRDDVTGIKVHTYGEDIKYDEDCHWRICTVCGEESNHNEHYYICGGDNTKCYFCGQADVNVTKISHSYYGNNYDFDQTQHWNTCLICNEKIYVENHETDETGKCYCGYITDLYITAQPVSVTVDAGEKASVSVKVTGDGLTYQWYFRDDDGSFSKSSTTKATYSVEMTEARDGRQVYCIITDANGKQVISATATLKMKHNAEIVQQPSDVYVIEGDVANVSVLAKGDGLTYTWYVKDVGGSKFVKSSIKEATYAFKLTAAKAGRQVYCVVGDAYGNTVQTATATIYLMTELKINSQPAGVVAVAAGEKASVIVSAQGDELTYEWFYKNPGASEFVKTSAYTSKSYSIEMIEARDGRQVYCVVTDKYGNSVTSNIVTLKVLVPLKIVTQPSDVTVIEGQTGSVSVAAEGTELTYQWYVKDVGAAAFVKSSTKTDTYSYKMTAEKAGRQVYCVITDVNGNTVQSNTATFTMKRELKITAQPGSVAVLAGEKASVSVKAQGDGLTYAWYFKEANGSKFYKSSVTSATYSVEMTAARAGRQVYCVVTDQYGDQVTSETATLNMKTALKITSQPASVTVVEGKTGSVSVVAEGDGLTYTWYLKDVGASKFGKSSVTGATYSYKMTAEKAGRQVYCVVTDQYGDQVTSETATFTMAAALKITAQPGSVAVLAGEKASVSVKAEGDGLTYAWYFKEANGSKFYKSSVTSATYSVEMTAARAGRQVYCVVTDQYGDQVTSETATLNMKTALKITAQPASVTVVEGKTGSVSVVAEGDGLTYTWYLKDVGASKFGKSSVTSATYSYKMTAEKAGRQVYCVVTDQYGDQVTSSTATFTMAAALKITAQPASVTVAAGEKASVYVKAEGEGLTYAWYFKDAGASNFSLTKSFTGASYTVEMTSARAGRQVYCVITDANGNSVQSATATLNMKAALSIVTQPNSVTVAEGETASVYVKAEGEGLTYAWYFKDAGASSFSLTKSFTGASYTVEMTSARAGRQVYCVITDANGNSVQSATATLNMKAALSIVTQPNSVTVAEGENASVYVKAEGEGLTYAWYFKDAGASSFSLTKSFTGTTYTVQMTTARAGRQVYCVITDANGNSVQSATATLNMK